MILSVDARNDRKVNTVNRFEHFKKAMLDALRTGAHTDVHEAAAHLGPDTPRRARIAQEILFKAKRNLSDKVRVERDYMRNGTRCHGVFWVLPSKVKKGDIVTQNAHLIDENARAQIRETRKPAKSKSGPAKSSQQRTHTSDNAQQTSGSELHVSEQSANREEHHVEAEDGTASVLHARVPDAPSDLFEKLYDELGLDHSDDLGTFNTFFRAMSELHYETKKETYHSDALNTLMIQHAEGAYGREELEKEIGRLKHAGYDEGTARTAAAAGLILQSNSETRQAVLENSRSDSPMSAPHFGVVSKALKEAIDSGASKQTKALYRGMHLPQSFLRNVLETGSVSFQGIASVSATAAAARAFAMNTKQDEVPVIFEFPKPMKMNTFEAGSEMLLHSDDKLSVQSVTKSKGVYKVKLTAGEAGGEIADDAVYRGLGAVKSKAEKRSALTHTMYAEVMREYCECTDPDHTNIYEIPPERLARGVEYIYKQLGTDGAVDFLSEFAEVSNRDDLWTAQFGATKTGYAPALLSLMRNEWARGQYDEMRRLEKRELSADANGEDVFYKIGSMAMNALVEKDGTPQTKDLHRGLKRYCAGMEQVLKAQEGDTITLGGLSSFTARQMTAKQFADDAGVVLHLNKQCRRQCAYIEGAAEDEAEYLVQDGEFRIAERWVKGNITHLRIEPVQR